MRELFHDYDTFITRKEIRLASYVESYRKTDDQKNLILYKNSKRSLLIQSSYSFHAS